MPSIERSVDLPAPDGPMIEMNSPGCTSKVMRRRTYIRPAGVSNTFSRFRMAMSGPVMGGGEGGCLRRKKFVCGHGGPEKGGGEKGGGGFFRQQKTPPPAARPPI